MLVMLRLIGWQGGNKSYKGGDHTNYYYFSFYFPLFKLEAISTIFFQKEFRCGDKIKMCGLDMGKEGISSCSKMLLEW
jgi:hypothetical protein